MQKYLHILLINIFLSDEEVIDEPIDTSYVNEYEEIENNFIKAEDAEKLKKLIDRW